MDSTTVPIVPKRWTSNSGFIKNEEGELIAAVLDGCTPEEENIIMIAPVAIAAIRKFIADANSGSFKLRGSMKELEKVLTFTDI